MLEEKSHFEKDIQSHLSSPVIVSLKAKNDTKVHLTYECGSGYETGIC